MLHDTFDKKKEFDLPFTCDSQKTWIIDEWQKSVWNKIVRLMSFQKCGLLSLYNFDNPETNSFLVLNS